MPFALHGTSLRLHVEHEVDAVEGQAHTASYRYVLQTGDAHGSWVIRWEYLRERPPNYPYALAHLHVRAELSDEPNAAATKALERLHLPTARVAFELVLRHLISEWGVAAKTDGWAEILEESLTGFHERRNAP